MKMRPVDYRRTTMRALVLTGPRECSVQEVTAPSAAPREPVVDVERGDLR
jgi:hypothetical protein